MANVAQSRHAASPPLPQATAAHALLSFHLHFFFFFKQKTAYEIDCDWSSDVCSSDLGGEIGKLEFATQFEPLYDRLEIDICEMFAENAANSGANQFAGDGVGALEFAFVFEFHLAGDGGKGRVNIGDARDHGFLAVARGALLGAADEALQSGDRQTLADARAAVHALVFARLKSDLFHDLAEIRRHVDLLAGIAPYPGFLRRDGHSFFDGGGIMRANFRTDAVLERRDDFAARGVILRIRRENDEHVEREAQRIALNLNVAFLHDVEEADLNFSGKVWQFVNGKNAAVGARKKPIVDGEFVGQVASAASRADGINIADNVGHGYVRRSQFLDKAILAGHPGDGCIVAFAVDSFTARAADGLERIVVDFAARDDRHFRIKQIDEAAQNAALGLASQAEKNKIVAGKQRIHDLRNDGVFIAVDAGEERLTLFDGPQQVAAELVLDGAACAPRIKIRDAF